jgi:putative two-component system response regulator
MLMKKPEILIVDDEAINLSILTNMFKSSLVVRACRSGEVALQILKTGHIPDIILLDIVMPGIDGYETFRRIRDELKLGDIPVIFITALDGDLDEDKGFRLGAVDYIVKPFRPVIVEARVNAQLELKLARDWLRNQNQWLEAEVNRRMKENLIIQDATMVSLSQLAETRDDNTGNHILRTCQYVEILARRLQTDPKYAPVLFDEDIGRIIKAAPLQDIGKIGIPDAILLKNGRLNEQEYEIIKRHSMIGAKTLRSAINKVLEFDKDLEISENNSALLFLREAEIIAEYHHERWDGTGYPCGLKGESIPLSARMMALADVFDALTTSRPYKEAWSFNEAASYIIEQKGTQFSPETVEAFESEKNAFQDVLVTITDTRQGGV